MGLHHTRTHGAFFLSKDIQMLYSDEELKRWWAGLSKQAQLELLAVMLDKMNHSDFAMSLASQYSRGFSFSPKQLAVIRKWYRD